MKNMLITAIGGDIGYGIIKAIKNSHFDFFIFGCDVRKHNYSIDIVDSFQVSPAYTDEENWLRFITGIIKEYKIEFFWPVTEQEIKIVRRNIDKFVKCKVVANSDEILKISLDKKKTVEYLSAGGVDTPKTWGGIQECDEKYPLVVKEKFGCGSHSVYFVNSHSELIEVYSKMLDPVIQEYVGSANEEYTLTVFSDGNIVNTIAFRRELGFGGMSRYVELSHDSQLDDIGVKVAKLLGLRGSINVQLRKCDSTYYVFEINPRISSTIGFREQLGFHDVEWWLDMLEGNTVTQYVKPTENAYGIRNVEEKVFYE